MRTIVVLPDGETWSSLDGCFICTVDEQQFSDLCDGHIGVNDINVLTELSIQEIFTKE